MKITVLSSKAVRPAYGSCGAPATTDDAIPLTVFDSVSLNEYVSVIYAFARSSPTNAELEAGLAKALVEYREWAGRLGQDVDGNPAILLNDAGARFVEAVTEVALESVMPLKPTPEVLSLHPNGKAAEELLLIQVTRFVCGSLVVGLATQHIVSDGRAASNFFLAWSQATRGAAIKPAPVHDRASFFKPRDPPQIEYEHRGAEFKRSKKVDDYKEKNHPDDEVVVSKVHFNRDLISKLKSVASANAHRPYSTLKCVVAHLWRCMTKARGLGGHEITAVRISVDGRARMNPPVPEGYVGNVVLWALPSTTVRELMTRPLQYAVELIHREVARINDGYFKSFVDFVSSCAVTKEGLVLMADAAAMVLSPNIEVDSWVRIPFCDLDFGGGPPLVFMPTYLPVEGQVFLVESSSGDGSIDAYVPLFSRSMDAFKSYCYTLEQGEDKKLATPELHQLVSVGTAQH